MDAIVDKNFGLPNPSLVPLNWPRHCVGSMDVALYCQRYKCTISARMVSALLPWAPGALWRHHRHDRSPTPCPTYTPLAELTCDVTSTAHHRALKSSTVMETF